MYDFFLHALNDLFITYVIEFCLGSNKISFHFKYSLKYSFMEIFFKIPRSKVYFEKY